MSNVTYVDHMGSDLRTVNAARVSFKKKSDELSERDRGLVSYLADHDHWTPFAHCVATVHIRAPIAVARQLFKHKVGLVENEVSRRYVDDDPEYVPISLWRGRAKNKKQGSAGPLPPGEQLAADEVYRIATKVAGEAYKELLRIGVAPEQARFVLPLGLMTEWYWTGSLSAFARVCRLRLDEHAQEETAEVARSIATIMEGLFPRSWQALMGVGSE